MASGATLRLRCTITHAHSTTVGNGLPAGILAVPSHNPSRPPLPTDIDHVGADGLFGGDIMTTTLQPMTALTSLDLTPVHPTLATFEQLETELSQVLLERQEAIHTALLALLTREHLILVGPPGTAKSRLIAQLAHQIRTSQGGSLSCFHWLMTRFTTPEDLFGPVSLQGLHQDRYVRKTAGRLPTASLVFLDEVLRGSDPILETLLTL
ncbi:MAG: AAA family ATPase, partial [Ktedonobacteraceae bacterium]|nr:AAA family ATPase [Ktedonobacteraceae bacterium]